VIDNAELLKASAAPPLRDPRRRAGSLVLELRRTSVYAAFFANG
jgi:hypothetical protein